VEKIVLKIAHFGQINNVTVGNNAAAEKEEEEKILWSGTEGCPI
jgi:hypothetical protein